METLLQIPGCHVLHRDNPTPSHYCGPTDVPLCYTHNATHVCSPALYREVLPSRRGPFDSVSFDDGHHIRPSWHSRTGRQMNRRGLTPTGHSGRWQGAFFPEIGCLSEYGTLLLVRRGSVSDLPSKGGTTRGDTTGGTCPVPTTKTNTNNKTWTVT